MRNPLRSEAEAFQFLLLVIACFGAIVMASLLGGRGAGVPVFAVAPRAVVFGYLRVGRPGRLPRPAPRPRGGPNDRRILVIANETVGGEVLRQEILKRAEGVDAQVLVVAPAL